MGATGGEESQQSGRIWRLGRCAAQAEMRNESPKTARVRTRLMRSKKLLDRICSFSEFSYLRLVHHLGLAGHTYPRASNL